MGHRHDHQLDPQGQVAVFIAVDHHNAECVGIHAARHGTVRAPEGNGCAERFIRTLKENLLWIQTFDTVEQLRLALLDFCETYNTTRLIQRLGYQTPAAVRQAMLSPAALAA